MTTREVFYVLSEIVRLGNARDHTFNEDEKLIIATQLYSLAQRLAESTE